MLLLALWNVVLTSSLLLQRGPKAMKAKKEGTEEEPRKSAWHREKMACHLWNLQLSVWLVTTIF